MDRAAAEKALIKLTNQTATAWRSVRREAFVGTTILETDNALYCFEDGVFSGRAPKPAIGESPAWVSPPNMKGAALIGFLADEGGLWSLSPRWRAGSLAVICGSNERFTLTSGTHSCTIERPERPLRPAPVRSDVFDVPGTHPPTVRRPRPPSMTRLQSAPPR
jgi:hypothetical protein